jgi:chromosome segregation ATPase
MKTMNLTLVLAVALVVSGQAHARTDVSAKVQQLKENKEASKQNLVQYEENLKTVNSNIVETEKALRLLKKQRESLVKQQQDTAKGKLTVDASRKQIEGFMRAEQAKLDTELKQIEQLKQVLATLESNVEKRQVNIAQYQEKMSKVEGELGAWSERNQSIVELEQAIKAKEDQARADQKRLAEKKASYEAETSKWKKQVRLSERQYDNFSKLKE